jgi:hypothetical protein
MVSTRFASLSTSELSELTCTDLEVGEDLAGSSDLLLQEAHDVVPAELAGFGAAVPVHNCKHARRNLAFESFGCCKLHAQTMISKFFHFVGATFWPQRALSVSFELSRF